MYQFLLCSTSLVVQEMLCEHEREIRLISEHIVGQCFTLNALLVGFIPLCIEMYLNDVEINEWSMKYLCLCISWILVWMYVCYVVFCEALIWMLWMNVKWIHGYELDVSCLYYSFMNFTKPTVFLIRMASRVRPSSILEDWIW